MFRPVNSVRLPILDSFVFRPLTSSLLVDAPSSVDRSPLVCNNLPYFLRHSSSIVSFKAAPKTHPFSSGVLMHCLRTCVRADVCQWFRLCMSVCAGGGGGRKQIVLYS